MNSAMYSSLELSQFESVCEVEQETGEDGVDEIVLWSQEEDKKIRFVAFDGGGVRACAALDVLVELEAARPDWRDNIAGFVGLSTGAVAAALLACGHPASYVRVVYADFLRRSYWRGARHWVASLGGVVGPRYSTKRLRQEVDRLFGKLAFGELKYSLLIFAYHLKNGVEAFTDGCSGVMAGTFGLSVRDAVLRAAATPTLFRSIDGYIDAGFLGDPAICLVLTHMDLDNITLKRIWALSFGTGSDATLGKNSRGEGGGILQWGSWVISMLMDRKPRRTLDAYLLGPRLLRIHLPALRHVAMDDATCSEHVSAHTHLENYPDWMARFFE